VFVLNVIDGCIPSDMAVAAAGERHLLNGHGSKPPILHGQNAARQLPLDAAVCPASGPDQTWAPQSS
jgi:hypothetical protein